MKCFLLSILFLIAGCVFSAEGMMIKKNLNKVIYSFNGSTLFQIEVPDEDRNLMKDEKNHVTPIFSNDVISSKGNYWILNRTYGDAVAYEGISGSYSVRVRIMKNDSSLDESKLNIDNLRRVLSEKLRDLRLIKFGENDFLYYEDKSDDYQTVDLYFLPLEGRFYLGFSFEYLGENKSKKILKRLKSKSLEILNSLTISKNDELEN